MRGAFEENEFAQHPMVAEHLAVVGSHDDQGILQKATPFECPEQFVEFPVNPGNPIVTAASR